MISTKVLDYLSNDSNNDLGKRRSCNLYNALLYCKQLINLSVIDWYILNTFDTKRTDKCIKRFRARFL